MEKEIMKSLKDYFMSFSIISKRFLLVYLLAVVMIVFAAIANAFSPLMLGVVINHLMYKTDDVSGFLNSQSNPFLLGLYAFLQIVSGLMNKLSSKICSTNAELISHEMRNQLMTAIFHDGLNHSAFNTESRGKVISLFNRDVEAVWDIFGYAIIELVSSFVLVITLSVIVIKLSTTIGFMFIITMVFFCFFILIMEKR